MVYDLVVTAVILLAGSGLGVLTLRLLRITEAGFFGFWVATSAGLGLLALLVLFSGALSLLRAEVLVPLTLVLSGVGLWALVAALRVHRRNARRWVALDSRPDRLTYAMMALIALSTLLWITLSHALLPPIAWDTVSYHLALPKLYIEARSLVYVPFIFQGNWPLAIQMLFTLGLLFGSDTAAQLVGFALSAWIALGCLIVGRRWFDDRVGILAAALFCVIPIVKRTAGIGFIDSAMGLFTLGAAVSFVAWQGQRQRGWLILCGMFCGMSAAAKLMGGGIAILFGLLVLGEEVRRWRLDQPQRDLRVLMLNLLRNGGIVALAGAALALPWYLRSYLNTGNPIWPFGYEIFGARDWDALGDEYNYQFMLAGLTANVPRSPAGLWQISLLLFNQPEQLGGYRGGLGKILPIGWLVAVLLWPWAKAPIRQMILVCAGFYLLWFGLVSQQTRFLLPIAPLLALITAWAAYVLIDRLRVAWLRVPALLALLLLLLLEWPWGMAGERALFQSRVPYLSGQESRADYLARTISIMPLVEYANSELPPDARIVLLPWETRAFYLDRDYIWGNPMAQRVIRFEQYATAEELRERLRELGVTHILENPEFIYSELRYWEQNRALMLDLEARCADEIARHNDAALFALRDQCRPGP